MSEPRSVVHVVRSDSFAGVERYICDVSAELVRRGWDVSVVGGDPDLMSRELPGAVEHLTAATTGAVFRALVRLRPLRLVHAHMTSAETASVLSRPLTRARVVATRHFAAPRGQHRLVRLPSAFLAGALAREIAISEFVGKEVGAAAVVLLNGVPDVREAADLESKCVLVMQRLQAEKDTATAVRAFAASGLAPQGWRLAIAGRGPESTDLRHLADGLGVGPAVDLLGFVREPARLREQASIFLATAPLEPFGLSVVEAMAAGLPVVAADGGAHREVLGDTGRLFPTQDVASCARHLRDLAGAIERRKELGQRAQSRQRRHLSLGRHVDALEGLYLEVAP